MPQLPTLTVPQAMADRILAAFGPGMTPQEAGVRYKEWLRTEVTRYVHDAEMSTLERDHQIEKAERQREILASMPQPEDPTAP